MSSLSMSFFKEDGCLATLYDTTVFVNELINDSFKLFDNDKYKLYLLAFLLYNWIF